MAHLFAELDYVVSAFVVNPHYPAVAFVHHKKLGIWAPIGGHIELGEDTDTALRRELKEEAGLRLGVNAEVYQTPEQRQMQDALQAQKFVEKDGHNNRTMYSPISVNVHDFPPLPGHRHLAHVFFVFSHTHSLDLEESAHHDLRWLRRSDVWGPDYITVPSFRVYAEEAMKARFPDRKD